MRRTHHRDSSFVRVARDTLAQGDPIMRLSGTFRAFARAKPIYRQEDSHHAEFE
jgi:hypothetical protein